jgi:Family of unknown function (DUF6166)
MMPGKVYRGERSARTLWNPEVTVDGVILDPKPSQAIRNHSPDGFEWGYSGSGPAQLALALLLDVVGQPLAELNYQRFKSQFVAGWAKDEWEIHESDIRQWVSDGVTPRESPVREGR